MMLALNDGISRLMSSLTGNQLAWGCVFSGERARRSGDEMGVPLLVE